MSRAQQKKKQQPFGQREPAGAEALTSGEREEKHSHLPQNFIKATEKHFVEYVFPKQNLS